MKRSHLIGCVGTSVAALALVYAAACSSTDFSNNNTTGGDGSVDGGGTNPGDGFSIPDAPPFKPGCEKSPSADPNVVRDDCGVFVKAGATGGNGTKGSPFGTIAEAVPVARSQSSNRVYVCAGTYPGAVVLDATTDGVSIFGGLDCASWAYTGAKAVVNAAAPGPALRITQRLIPALIEDLELSSAAATSPGDSSIGVIVESSSSQRFSRCKIASGDGQPGGQSDADNNYTGTVPTASGSGCVNPCNDGTTSAGGRGGVTGQRTVAGHTVYYGNPGDAGLPARAGGWGGGPSFVDLVAGTSETCTDGDAGVAGGPGKGGSGGSLGYFDAGFWVGNAGQAGAFGEVGQGGGGGGGAADPNPGSAKIGGGGGCGGCGGARGRAGRAGGSSFAFVSLQSNVLLDACQLVAGNAGAGGTGGNGGGGQAGGAGQTSTCSGGPGGSGGAGGGGGGGAGGSSFAVVYTGSEPQLSGGTTRTAGSAGTPGGAGTGGSPAAGTGAQGESGESKLLP